MAGGVRKGFGSTSGRSRTDIDGKIVIKGRVISPASKYIIEIQYKVGEYSDYLNFLKEVQSSTKFKNRLKVIK